MKKRILITISVFVILSLIGFFYWHYRHQNKAVTPKVTVQRGSITEQAEAIGYIKPKHSSIIKSQVNGTVAELYHEAGDYVTRGTPLLKIDPAPAPAEYAATYQALISAKAIESSAKLDLARYKRAIKAGIITKNYTDYLLAEKQRDTARVDRILAEQKLALMKRGKTKVGGKKIANIVSSPINGYIINKMVDVGDAVLSLSSAQASTALFAIANMHNLMFKGVVDEMDAAKIKVGSNAKVIIGSMPDKPITGALTKIALQSDKENTAQGATSTITDSPFNVGFAVEITKLKLPKGVVIRSGYSATAKIKIKTASNVLTLPARVIQYKQEKPYVLLPAKKPDAKPKEKPVTLGLSDGMQVEIKSGLKLGEKVLDKQETAPNKED